MKVGILTRRYGYNMGSTLQAYAIATLVKDYGHDVEVINYDETAEHPRWKIRPMLDHLMYNIRFLFSNSKKKYLIHRHQQEGRFHKFEREYLPLTQDKIRSHQELAQFSKRYDKIVVGSDQIWSPFLFDTNYFGEFLSKGEKSKIIPYAPSIGTSKISDIGVKECELLRELSTLSCREEAGSKIIAEITGKNVPVVLDPTLMLLKTEWDKIAINHGIKNLPSNYVVTYFLGKSIPNAVIGSCAIEKGAKVVNVNMFNRPNNVHYDINLQDIGPGEFLYLISNAEHVFTDSFHATIFSWIFNRPFTVFERFKTIDTQNQNSRIYTLLDILGCQSALYDSGNTCNQIAKIEEYRKFSSDYLISALI